ncbi:phospholipase A2 inhibitor and Ly6/PLAUR domain-containing protein-like [Pyxicephalus adspersus]|uniref:UPAR/Ly6 domain-containing protein n=1 Tax=Pyxicephalus adspersus TaxID=30357 RepID=A0AAV2ZN45_PYXAD|nr:TPA: hypothetical protein GDO54_003248 [Pyxicephalus adspersus]
MASFFGVVGTLLSLVAFGYALSCMDCRSADEKQCIGPTLTCAHGFVCKAEKITFKGHCNVTGSYVKTCAPINQCALKGIARFPKGMNLKMSTSCCTTNNCNPDQPTFPAAVLKHNGIECPFCMSEGSDCYSSENMPCTGNETMCIYQTADITVGKSLERKAFRGCATQSICNLIRLSYGSNGIHTDIKISCTSGTKGLQNGFYILAIICPFLLKLFENV